MKYIYDDYGKYSYDFSSSGVFGSRAVNFSENTGRAALEYKF
jgi:hypothetical protein